jgi:hypothetical protein
MIVMLIIDLYTHNTLFGNTATRCSFTEKGKHNGGCWLGCELVLQRDQRWKVRW